MGSSFDYKGLVNYTNNFKKMYFDFDRWIFYFLMNEGMRFIADVKRRTPVDTGSLRGAWTLETVTRRGDELYCWFSNPMYYADFVEYGHAKPYRSGAKEGSDDWVDGYFMMTVALDAVYRKMPAQFNTELRKFLMTLGTL